MNAKLLGFFSGFPARRFTDGIAEVLEKEIDIRDRLVFISCQPDNFSQNDDDSEGMYGMFAERNIIFREHRVIDNRTGADAAVKLIRGASVIFLMGGNATRQARFMRETRIYNEIRQSGAVVLGVSAGAMNMGKNVVDVYESLVPYEGLGLADITLKAHYPFDDEKLLQELKQVSMTFPVFLMSDESAVFIKKDGVMPIGQIYRMIKGDITPVTHEQIEKIRIV